MLMTRKASNAASSAGNGEMLLRDVPFPTGDALADTGDGLAASAATAASAAAAAAADDEAEAGEDAGGHATVDAVTVLEWVGEVRGSIINARSAVGESTGAATGEQAVEAPASAEPAALAGSDADVDAWVV